MSKISNNITDNKLSAKPNTKIGIVKSEYNSKITDTLFDSCKSELEKSGVSEKNIFVMTVPGAYELPFGCQKMIKSNKPDAVIALGAVIKGQTPHFDYIASSAANGIMDVSLKTGTPIIFGVLTTNNLAQAKARIKGGSRGDKGVEAAQTAIKILNT
ncbi:6,7-dimethyl-8-ribityllumazine synthase [Patescibacteria group bacterium]|nr:6,7-dimethyl-8-ribityllumazine synthase [Patescibacteria group bacterium]MBU1682958.1 6,7-dimethyl-8-ribityllumazine synthase [Patescibacteria group bacterium]MBU1934870.1 6,7-dimethyl-8-ribityllumazine synthase [Patescibacteria group bacterium]